MATPQCSAIANALAAKGYNSGQLASQIGSSQAHVDNILSGRAKPTQKEFSAIASALGLSNAPSHAANVTA